MKQTDLFGDIFEESAEVASQEKEADKNTLTYEDFPHEDLYTYAGIDCIATSELLSKLMPTLSQETPIWVPGGKGTAPAILDSFWKIEIPAHEFIIDMEINGMNYSVDRNTFYDINMQKRIAELDDKIFSAIGDRIDLNSGPSIAAYLYNKRGFTPPTFTKAGEPATDGDAFLTLAGLDPTAGKYITADPEKQWLADMAVRRDISAVHNTFIKTYVKDFVKRDGKLHPSYNQFGTSSFRITGSDPNLTQLPRARHGYNIRTCYTVEKGEVFISFDFSSAEVKVLANIAKEPAMLKAISENLDFHSYSASAMLGIPYVDFVAALHSKDNPKFKEYKEARQLAKILTFSILYGASVAGIAAQLNLEQSEASRLMALYFDAFPGVKKYIQESHMFATKNHFIVTPLGQRKMQFGTYPCFKPTAAFNASLRNSQNSIIQSATSTIGLATFAYLNAQIKKLGAKSICTVYDSIEIACPIDKAAEVIGISFDVLNNYPQQAFPFLQLPIGCEGDVGISWGETLPVHPGITQEEVLVLINKCKEDSLNTFGKWIP